LDIIVIDKPLDNSPRAQSRSPAWQKCLVLGHPDVAEYDQVAWVDSDIIVNPESPSLFRNVPLDLVGAVDEYASPTREDYGVALQRAYRHWFQIGVAYVENTTPTDFHRRFGLEGDFEAVVQTGVLVVSPGQHRAVLERVYYDYEDKKGLNYEMRPLSYEILVNGLAHWINPKFNALWVYVRQLMYPFLRAPNRASRRIQRAIYSHFPGLAKGSLWGKCATTAFLNNYFLHFAGAPDEMKFVDQDRNSDLL
jgi:hypothetical protein